MCFQHGEMLPAITVQKGNRYIVSCPGGVERACLSFDIPRQLHHKETEGLFPSHGPLQTLNAVVRLGWAAQVVDGISNCHKEVLAGTIDTPDQIYSLPTSVTLSERVQSSKDIVLPGSASGAFCDASNGTATNLKIYC